MAHWRYLRYVVRHKWFVFRAPRWVPWLNGPEEPNELCRGCLYRGARVEVAAG